MDSETESVEREAPTPQPMLSEDDDPKTKERHFSHGSNRFQNISLASSLFNSRSVMNTSDRSRKDFQEMTRSKSSQRFKDLKHQKDVEAQAEVEKNKRNCILM